MASFRIGAVGLLLALAAAAQTAPPAPGTSPGATDGAAPAIGPGGALAQELYRDVRFALVSAPDAITPRLLLDMASGEVRLFPAQAEDDFVASFNAARALAPDSAGAPALARVRQQIKAQTEAAAITALARAGATSRALGLVRTADIPRGPLYDVLLIAAGQAPPPAAGAPAPATSFADQVFALVQECKHADNTYPYRGVTAVIRSQQLDPLDRMQLIRDAYRWAGNETDPRQIAQAPVLLQAAHTRAPELDAELEPVVVTLLTRLAQDDDLGAGTGPSEARLLSLLATVDPARAAALAADYPNLSTAPPPPTDDLITLPSLQFSAGDTPIAPNPMQPAGGPQFVSLVAAAQGELRQDPSAASADANHAADLLDEGLWSAEAPLAAELATVFQRLGVPVEANRIMTHCLDIADQQARAADIQYQSAPSETQAEMLQTLESSQAEILEVYALAARLNLSTTAVRAETVGVTLLKPLILMRVAEIAMSEGP